MIPELRQSIESKKYYRPPIIKLSKKTKRKVASVELFILELFEKVYSFLKAIDMLRVQMVPLELVRFDLNMKF